MSRKRCAIYTRKSSEEGLEQSFNSLDAQREACAAYVLSQAGEGWEALPEQYDDGGWSGGSMDRPALKQLLGDIRDGKVDIVVVYKVDRLTRSLADFAKIVEILDAKGVSFVSVTQAFNTTSSMGRLTLNVLLSFAQFEREVTGERIRDKIAASKRKGMWMGGAIPLGFKVEERKLLIHAEEAKEVIYIFNRYLELRSVPALADDLAAKGIRTRRRTMQSGRSIGGVCFGRGALAHLLKNPIYIGRIKHKGAVYDGEHDVLIDPELFEQVQQTIAANRHDKGIARAAAAPSLLAGRITDPDGLPMSPTRGQKGSKHYCYYATRTKPGEDRASVWRLPTGELDRLVMNSVARHITEVRALDPTALKTACLGKFANDAKITDILADLSVHERRALLIELDVTVQLRSDHIDIAFAAETISIPAKLVRKGHELRLSLPPDGIGTAMSADPSLVRLMALAFAARDHLLTPKQHPLIATYQQRHQQRLARLSWLAPDIVAAIIGGRQPAQLTARHLLRCGDVPLGWQSQRRFSDSLKAVRYRLPHKFGATKIGLRDIGPIWRISAEPKASLAATAKLHRP